MRASGAGQLGLTSPSIGPGDFEFARARKANPLVDAVRELRFCAFAAPIITVPHDAQDYPMGKGTKLDCAEPPSGDGRKGSPSATFSATLTLYQFVNRP